MAKQTQNRGRPRIGERVRGPYERADGRFHVSYYAAAGGSSARTFGSEKAALNWIRQIRRDIAADGQSVHAALNTYKKHCKEKGMKPRSISNGNSAIKTLVGDTDRQMTEVTASLLRRRLNALAKVSDNSKPHSVDTRASYLRVTKTWMRWCVTKGWTSSRTMAQVDQLHVLGKRNQGKKQLLIDEARAYLAKGLEMAQERPGRGATPLDLDELRRRREGALAALCPLLLGIRSREILDRQVRDLDDGGRVLWISKAKTRAGDRRVLVPDIIRELLLAQVAGRESGARVFGERRGTGRARSTSWMRNWVDKVCAGAEVERVTPHGLRGTHSTLAEAAGVTAEVVAASLGHEGPGVTGRHYTAPGVREARRQVVALGVLQGGQK